MSDPIEIDGKDFVFKPLKMRQKAALEVRIGCYLATLQGGGSIDDDALWNLGKMVLKYATIDGFEIKVDKDEHIEEAFGGDILLFNKAVYAAAGVNFKGIMGKLEAVAKNPDSSIGQALRGSGLASEKST